MALLTAAEYKTYAGITDAAQDTLIAAMIPRVQAKIERHCNRLFEDGATARTEYFDGDGKSNCIWPKYLPIVSVTSLHDDTDRGYGAAYLISSNDYVVYDRRVELDGLVFCKGLKNIKLVYVGGYVPTGESANVPHDLKLAMCELLSWTMQRMGKEAEQSESNTQLNISRTWIVELPREIKRDLAPYRRHAMG